MIVVDTNVLAYFWMQGEYTKYAKSLYKSDDEWISPFLWRSEFRSILALYIRKGVLKLEDSIEIMRSAQFMMKSREYSVDSIFVLEKINTCSLSAYDLEFVTLAESLNLKLITLDKKMIAEFPDIVISLKNYNQ